jgi:hypothetical protein
MTAQTDHRRGFLSMDLAAGLGLAVFLLMILTGVIVQQRGAESRLARVRAAVRTAEASLLQLQNGQGAASETKVDRLADAAPAGHAWVRVTATGHEAAAAGSIVGLVPATALEGGRR